MYAKLFQNKSTVHGTKKDAEKVRNKLLREKDLGILATPTHHTLDEYLDHWLEVAAKPRLRAKTFDEYKRQIARYVRPTLGHLKLTQVRPVTIQGLYGDMLNRNLSSRTVRLTHAILRNALDQAVKWQILTYNPADAVDLPRHEKQEMKVLSQEEANRFLEAAK